MEATIHLDPAQLEDLAERSADRALKKLLDKDYFKTRPGDGKFMTNEAVMTYLGLSRPTLQRYRDSGRLPFSKIGRKVFYRRADVDALLETGLQSRRERSVSR